MVITFFRHVMVMCLALLVSVGVFAAERKSLADVVSDDLVSDTQVMLPGAGDDHLAMAWWMPNEFWASLFARDQSMSAGDKKSMMDTLDGVSLLVVVQADISQMGSFNFYGKKRIADNMQIRFVDAKQKSHAVQPLSQIDSDLELVLNIFKPILGAALGNMGNNMHFYVLSDVDGRSRLMDPYQKGSLTVQLERSDEQAISAEIAMPLNALFVPRLCPNGKPAHISWAFCPWSGQKVKD